MDAAIMLKYCRIHTAVAGDIKKKNPGMRSAG